MSIKKKQYWAPKTDATMENPPFEDVFPIQNWVCSNVTLVFSEVEQLNVTDTGFCYKLDELLLR